MTGEMLFVFTVLGLTIVVFLLDRFRMDLVALCVMVVLALSGIIAPAQAVSGFAEPVVLMIAGLFIVGEALFRTGVAAQAGQWLMQLGGRSELRLLLMLLPLVAVLSAFMSSTGAVALLIPVVLSITRNSDIQASHVLMPMAFAALIGGMLTLIGTPPNLIVSDALSNAGYEPFGFFTFTPLGVAILIAGMAYLLLAGRRLLPSDPPPQGPEHGTRLQSLLNAYDREEHLYRVRIPTASALAGQTIMEARLRSRFEVTVFARRRQSSRSNQLEAVLADTSLQAGDELWLYGHAAQVSELARQMELEMTALSERDQLRLKRFFGATELLVTPRSSLVGKTLRDSRFREHHQCNVIGVRRGQETLDARFADTPLEAGDALLVAGAWNALRKMQNGADFVITSQPSEMAEAPTRSEKAPIAIGVLVLMVVAMSTGLLDNLTAVLLAALAVVLTGCLNLPQAYRSLNAQSLVLIAGMIPLALAMEQSGAAEFLVAGVLERVGAASPLLILTGVFVLTALLSQFISNTATTVLMAPLTLGIAEGMGLSPLPLLMAVAIAASTAFATPIASPVNTLVVTPGHYRFTDFMKVGIPLQIIALLVMLLLLPRLLPF